MNNLEVKKFFEELYLREHPDEETVEFYREMAVFRVLKRKALNDFGLQSDEPFESLAEEDYCALFPPAYEYKCIGTEGKSDKKYISIEEANICIHRDTETYFNEFLKIFYACPGFPSYVKKHALIKLPYSFPEPDRILSIEVEITRDIIQLLKKHEIQVIVDLLTRKYFLTHLEARGAIEIARNVISDNLHSSVDNLKYQQVARLEAYTKRARRALDIRAELAALKEMNSIMGLKKIVVEDVNTQMVNTIAKVASKDIPFETEEKNES